MNRDEISKEQLYEGVKALVECSGDHIHLPQHKLYTLVSIGFQYLLYMSTKKPGAYLIRVEDSLLMDKLVRRSKDQSTRRFLENLTIPRRLKYGKSTFYLDYFQLSSWGQTSEIPKDRIRAALVIKNANKTPLEDSLYKQELQSSGLDVPEIYYYNSLQEFVPKTIVIGYEEEYPETEQIEFSFIRRSEEKTLSGVKLSKDVNLNFEDDKNI